VVGAAGLGEPGVVGAPGAGVCGAPGRGCGSLGGDSVPVPEAGGLPGEPGGGGKGSLPPGSVAPGPGSGGGAVGPRGAAGRGAAGGGGGGGGGGGWRGKGRESGWMVWARASGRDRTAVCWAPALAAVQVGARPGCWEGPEHPEAKEPALDRRRV